MRLILAVWAAKLAALLGKLLGKKSSSTPGEIALKICPDLIERLKGNIKGKVFVTCGTNGKTTTNNLLCMALEKSGYSVLCNKVGANMISGVANVFALSCNIFGKFSADYACFEIDEAYAVKVFDKIIPDVMIVTNLFRDQLDRYGEIDITKELLNKAIDKCKNSTIILNGDDPLSTGLGKNRKNVKYFGISEKVLEQTESVKEGRYCSECKAELEYNFYHYSQLGDYYCPACGFRRPEIDYDATGVSTKDGIEFVVNGKDKIKLCYRGFYNIYNVLAVYSAISASGVNVKDEFSKLFDDYKPQIGRMEEFNIGKPVILNLAKNPAGFNQAIMTFCEDKRKKDVIISVNDYPSDGQDVSWLWDVDFERVYDENTNLLITSGRRVYDLTLRFKYSNINVDLYTNNIREAIEKCAESNSEAVYVLVNYTELFKAQDILVEMQKKIEGGDKNE